MGLTSASTGKRAADQGLKIERRDAGDRIIALAGNPNVGKSTVFNALTGMKQHTGNWPGKTVCSAAGEFIKDGIRYVLVDLPGAYSLMAHSAEEEVARDFLCFGGADAAVVVCDATCLERNMNLVLQTIEIQPRTLVLINLLDEAEKKQIHIDLALLEERLGVPVVGTTARSGKGLERLTERIREITADDAITPIAIRYPEPIEEAIALVESHVMRYHPTYPSARWVALKLLEGDTTLTARIAEQLGIDPASDDALVQAFADARRMLTAGGFAEGKFKDALVSELYRIAEELCREAVRCESPDYNDRQLKVDRVLTSRRVGIPLMLGLLMLIFYLTIVGANYPSELLAKGSFWLQDRLSELFYSIGAPDWLHGALILGVYRVLAWVVSVMLPPMAIFFPLFTLLEDLGYLPRIAFNLDKHFKKCCACGKQALCMCMRPDRMRKGTRQRMPSFNYR
ncbi:MAG: ferrous iron transporter B [Clostridia bacterium]|nr:ferrous iron transporter B [Clostridia bacterium]